MRVIAFLRSLFVVLIPFPIMTIVYSIAGFVWYVLRNDRSVIEFALQSWGRLSLKWFNIHMTVSGQENIPPGACLFLFNHTSFVDIFALGALIPKLRFGAKIELFSIPIFGLGLRASGALPIARKNREKAIRILSEAEERARQGERFALSPEGGRNYEEKLLPFKSGPFIFAINTKIPIVPVVIKGAKDAWPKNVFIPAAKKWRYEMQVEFLPPVSAQEYTIENRSQLVEKVRNLMEVHF